MGTTAASHFTAASLSQPKLCAFKSPDCTFNVLSGFVQLVSRWSTQEQAYRNRDTFLRLTWADTRGGESCWFFAWSFSSHGKSRTETESRSGWCCRNFPTWLRCRYRRWRGRWTSPASRRRWARSKMTEIQRWAFSSLLGKVWKRSQTNTHLLLIVILCRRMKPHGGQVSLTCKKRRFNPQRVQTFRLARVKIVKSKGLACNIYIFSERFYCDF